MEPSTEVYDRAVSAPAETARTAPPALDAAACWQAVLSRSPAADALFCYSVATTGVYCRPSCGARRPRRQNVAFHATAALAERAGFRPCKRCQPSAAPRREREAQVVAALCRQLESELRTPTLAELAATVGLSPAHTHRLFRAGTGVTPRAYAAAWRAERARVELASGGRVTDAIYAAGYGSSGRFYEAAAARLGMTPKQYRAGAPNLAIAYAGAPCSLGTVLVATTAKGVCAVLLGDNLELLVGDLQRRFPGAQLRAVDGESAGWLASVVALVEQPHQAAVLPLDIRGTAFQERVWQALQAIAPGAVVTYSQLAESIGAKAAVRAVASACAKNPLAVVVPCHRVVRSDGDLAGYAWGLERKRALLERERDGVEVGPGGVLSAVDESSSRR